MTERSGYKTWLKESVFNLLHCITKCVISTTLILTPFLVFGQSTHEWDLKSRFGITQEGIAQAITEARDHFTSSPNDTIIINIDAGTYEIGGNGSPGLDFNSGLLFGSAKGRLVFQGAGMLETTLVFVEKGEDMVKGRDVYHLEFRDMTMTRTKHSVTQGTVVSIGTGQLVLDIEDGFPTPLELFAVEGGGGRFNAGRYLRKYDNTDPSDPQVVRENNQQVPWGWRNETPVYPVQPDPDNSPSHWLIYLNDAGLDVNDRYNVGDYIGVKSKSEGHIYWFVRGSDLVFRNIRWFHSSRGLVRGGFSNVGLYGCRIDRGEPINGQTPCLATPSGGPQMNQDGDPVSTNMVVEDCYFDSTGDDNVAFFNVNGGRVRNTVIRNGFARGILATANASSICLDNITMENAYIEDGPLGIDHWSEEAAVNAEGAFDQKCLLISGLRSRLGNDVGIYPNPLEEYIEILLPIELAGSQALLFHSSGGLIKSLILQKDKNRISMRGLEMGVYVLRISNGSEVINERIIKR